MAILIGNSFPLSLIRRKVIIEPAEFALDGKKIISFWGHDNTIKAASKFIGHDLSPLVERPQIKLDDNNLPTINGETFTECWIVSPIYKDAIRPAIGEEVANSAITNWQTLKITWQRS